MINHARTVLLNGETNGPGSEYMPAYRPKELPVDLQSIWTALFGEAPSDFAKNYRVRQLMIILHSTELEKYVMKLDPRITYLSNNNLAWCMRAEPEELPPLTDVIPVLEQLLQNYEFKDEFAHYWNEYAQFAYQLGAVMLEFIYRAEALDEMARR